MLEKLKHVFSRRAREAGLKDQLDKLRTQLPVPVFWLIGKTQSGKTSIIKHLTGAEDAEIGRGFQACTRFSRQYQFPTAEAPLMTFLDTRAWRNRATTPGKTWPSSTPWPTSSS